MAAVQGSCFGVVSGKFLDPVAVIAELRAGVDRIVRGGRIAIFGVIRFGQQEIPPAIGTAADDIPCLQRFVKVGFQNRLQAVRFIDLMDGIESFERFYGNIPHVHGIRICEYGGSGQRVGHPFIPTVTEQKIVESGGIVFGIQFFQVLRIAVDEIMDRGIKRRNLDFPIFRMVGSLNGERFPIPYQYKGYVYIPFESYVSRTKNDAIQAGIIGLDKVTKVMILANWDNNTSIGISSYVLDDFMLVKADSSSTTSEEQTTEPTPTTTQNELVTKGPGAPGTSAEPSVTEKPDTNVSSTAEQSETEESIAKKKGCKSTVDLSFFGIALLLLLLAGFNLRRKEEQKNG